MANEKLKQGAESIDKGSRTFGGMLNKLDVSTKKFRGKRGSIISAAKGNIFEFPVFISNSIPLDYAEATSALLEQVFASYLQMAISINPVIDHTQASNGLQFSGLRTDTNKYLEYTDTMWQHDACHAEYNTDEAFVEFNMISYTDADAKVILEDVNYQPLEEFEHFFTEAKDYPAKKKKKTNDTTTDNSKQASDVTMDDLKTDTKDDKYVNPDTSNTSKDDNKKVDDVQAAKNAAELEANNHKQAAADLNKARMEFDKSSKALASVSKKYDDLIDKLEGANDKEKEALRKEIELTRKERDSLKQNNEKERLSIKKLEVDIKEKENKAAATDRDHDLNQGDLANKARVKAPKVLSEKDMEKLNTMKPILMTVDLNVKSDSGTLSPVEYIVGVKTYNRMIDADIIPEVVEYPLKEMNKIARKAKWRAGELKFFSDIVFRIKEKKQTAVDAKDPKRKWYRRLYELAHMKGDAQTANIVNGGSVIASFIFDKQGKTKSVHGLVPNVAMVISKTDVDICKMKTGIDLLNGKQAAKFCNELFMMCLVVTDVDAESIKILLPELHNEFDVHSIASVNRQIASLDSSNKAVKNMMGLMNR